MRAPPTPPRCAPVRCCSAPPGSSTASTPPPTGAPTTSWRASGPGPPSSGWCAKGRSSLLRASPRASTWPSRSSPRCTAPRWHKPSSSASSTTRSRRSTRARPPRHPPRSSNWCGASWLPADRRRPRALEYIARGFHALCTRELAGFELLDGHEDDPGLRPFGGTDHASLLQQVHDPPGPGETHPQLALQHRRRTELRAHDQLHGGVEHVVIVVAGCTAADAEAEQRVVAALHALDVLRLGLAPPVAHDLAHL